MTTDYELGRAVVWSLGIGFVVGVVFGVLAALAFT